MINILLKKNQQETYILKTMHWSMSLIHNCEVAQDNPAKVPNLRFWFYGLILKSSIFWAFCSLFEVNILKIDKMAAILVRHVLKTRNWENLT